jgi:YHS domain-containing protein
VTLAAFVFLLAATHTPEECVVTKGKAAFTAEHAGKTYGFQFEDCRETFLADPERYAQLYDALAEMSAEGLQVAAPRSASLVPS